MAMSVVRTVGRGRGHPLARAAFVWTVLALAAAAALLGAIAVGSTAIAFPDVVTALFTREPSSTVEVIRQLRLPRALAAFATGGLLAIAGAMMQVLLRNPLADPYVLGVSGGAAVGALGAMTIGLGVFMVDVAALAGALVSVLLVFGLAQRDLAQMEAPSAVDPSPRLLLTGVILASGWSAIITLLLTVAPEAKLRGMLFWLMGDLAGADDYLPALIALPVVIACAFALARECNVLLRGPVIAHSLGVRVARLRRMLYVLASIATALAVTTAGAVGFIGLVVPHALRIVIGNDQRVLLPASALAGGTLLLVADTAARTVLAPQQLPVGVLTAMLGVPAFMLLLLRRS